MKRSLTISTLVLSIVVAVASTPLSAVAVPRATEFPPAASPLGTSSPDVTPVGTTAVSATPKGAATEQPQGEAIGLIVRYAKGVRPVVSGTIVGSSAVAVPLSVGNDLGNGWHSLTFAATMTAAAAREAADQLASSPLVLEAYPNLIHYLTQTSTNEAQPATAVASIADWTMTTQTSSTWGLGRIDQASLPLDYSYTYDTTGSGVKAYIVDSGIRTTHTEFTGRLAAGYHLPTLSSTADCDGHGTHVAGTVGGTTYGVAKKVTIVPVRIFDCDGGVSTEDINLSLDWIMSDHQAGTPAVVNMSLGGSRDDLMDAKIQDVIDSGITVVVAAGNEGQNSCDVSPARLPGAITVNASTLIDDDAIYSNWGECSDLYAPGTDVTSAWFNGNTATATISGTSMASPHVAGAVARILSASPTLTPAQVWAKLAVAATPFDPGLNDDIEANCEGFGLDPDCVGADPEKLLYAGLFPTDSTVPVPTGLVATPGAGTIGLTWSALDETNGPIIDYVIQYRWTNQSTYTTFDDGISVSRDVTITRLRPAYAHSVRVAAQTASGVGAFSADTLVSTLDVSVGAPTTVSATSGLTTVQLRWTAPTISSAAGTINDYLISYRVAGTTSWSIFADGTSVATTATVRSLSRGKSYDFSVKATIPYREGTAAVLRGSTLTGIATAPTALATSSTTTTSLALRWVAPSKTNGGVITDYIVRYRVAGTTTWLTFADGKRTATTATITRLVRNKSYNVEVKAVTLAGSTALNGATVTGRFATRR